VDPGGKEAILKAGGPGPPGEGKGGQLASDSGLRTVEEDRHSEMAKDAGDGLATYSRDIYAQSECYCALCSRYTV
jgi:hypothetical protein